MSLFNAFETDPALEKNGIVLDYGPNKDLPKDENGKHPTIEVLVRRAGGSNDAFNKRIEALSKKYRRSIQNETIDTETLRDITKQAIIETVIIGWKNVTGRDKKLLDFNVANANLMFDMLPDWYTDISESSGKAALFRKNIREDDAKN